MIDATLLLFVLFIVTVFLALMLREAYAFAMAAFLSVIFGIQLAVSAGVGDEWSFQVVGFAFILFGFWLLLPAYKISLEEKKGNAA